MLQLFKESSKLNERYILLAAAIQKAINSQLKQNNITHSQVQCSLSLTNVKFHLEQTKLLAKLIQFETHILNKILRIITVLSKLELYKMCRQDMIISNIQMLLVTCKSWYQLLCQHCSHISLLGLKGFSKMSDFGAVPEYNS